MTEWYNYCAAAQWSTPQELKTDIRTASVLKNNRVVFNLCGNKYRIVVLMDYLRHGMLIRFVGTHRQYDEIDDIENILGCNMRLKPIKSDRELERALARIDELWGSKPDTPKGDELDVLMLLVEKYEDEHYAIPASDPIEAIKFLMEQKDLSRKDLEPYLGTSARVSEILNKKRSLTLSMIKKLHEGLNIPYECLIA